jgi:hypothetical protein
MVYKFFGLESTEVRNYVITREILLALADKIKNAYLLASQEDRFIYPGNGRERQIKADFVDRGTLINGKKRLGLPKYIGKGNMSNDAVMAALRGITSKENAEKIVAAYSQNPTYLVPNTISFGMIGGLDQSGIIIRQPDQNSVTHNLVIEKSRIILLSLIEKFNVVDSRGELIGFISGPVQALFSLVQINEDTWGFQLENITTSNEVLYKILMGQLVSPNDVIALIQKSKSVKPNSVTPTKTQEPNVFGLDESIYNIINSYDFSTRMMRFIRHNSRHVKHLGLIITILHQEKMLNEAVLDKVEETEDFKSIATMLKKCQELHLFEPALKDYFRENKNGMFYVAQVLSLIKKSDVTKNVALLIKNINICSSIWLMLEVLDRFDQLTDSNIRIVMENPKSCMAARPYFENLLSRREVANNPELVEKIFLLFMKHPLFSQHIYGNPTIFNLEAIEIFEKEIKLAGKDY